MIRSKNILVVEADPAYLRLISAALRGEGYQVTTADNARDLRDIFSSSRVDIVLADATLDGLSNLPADIPLILMTSRLSGQLRKVAHQLGATTSIHRPIYPDELKRALRSSSNDNTVATIAA